MARSDFFWLFRKIPLIIYKIILLGVILYLIGMEDLLFLTFEIGKLKSVNDDCFLWNLYRILLKI